MAIKPDKCGNSNEPLDCATDSVEICSHYEYPEDSPHVSGDTGAFFLAVRHDANSPLAGDGDYIPLTTDNTGALRTTANFSGDVTIDIQSEYPEDSPHVSGDIGSFSLAVRNDSAATLTSTNGDYSPFAVDAAGRIGISDLGGSITVDGTVAATQSGVWSTGRTWDLNFATDQVDASGSIVALDAATLAALESITIQNPAGAGAVNIQDGGNSITVDAVDLDIRNLTFAQDKVDASGSTVSIAGAISATIDYSYPEDSPHVSGDKGAFILAVRNDAAAALTNTNGDYSPIATDSAGRIGISDLGGSITVDGTITANQGTSPWVTSLDAASLAALESITVQNGPGAAAVNIQDGGNSITVDGTITTNQGTSPWVTSLDAASLAALESITVQNGAGAAAVNIQDGGNSITVDGSINVGNTVTTADDKVEDNPHASGDTGSFVLGVRNDAAAVRTNTDGDYSPISTDSAGRVGISDLGGSISIDDNAGSITVDGTVAVTQSTSPWVVSGTVTANQGTNPWVTSLDAASLAALESITVQNGAGAAAVNIQDGGNSITVDGSVSISGTVSTGDNKTEDNPHASGDTGSFVLGVRNDSAAVRTNTDGDYSPISTDSAGRIGISDLGGSISIDDNAGSITVDGTVAVTQSTSPWVTSLDAASLAALESITIQNGAGASAVNIQDGGNSITIDGTVTADTNFDYAEDAPHVSGDPGAFVLGVRNDAAATRTNTDGDYSPISTDAAGRIGIADLGGSITVDGTVSVTQPVAVTDNAGSLTVDNPTLSVVGGGTEATALRVTVANDSTGVLSVDDNGGSLTVDGTVTANQGTTPWVVAEQSGTITNGAETAVSSAAVQILAANASRKKYIIQNTGTANIRVGVSGVTATTGARLLPNGTLLFEMPNCPTQAIFAIREGASDSIAFAQEIT